MRFYRRLLLLLSLQLFTSSLVYAKVDTLKIISDAMNKTIPNLVVTPGSYTHQGQKLPVLYLLHGAGGDFKQWLGIEPELQKYSDQYNFIIVCPDGGKTSWYFDSPIDKSMKYETYVSHELVKAIDKNYNTVQEKKGRAISGLSMGGHGAFYLALRHMDIYGAIGSTSGGLDIRPFPDNWDLPKRLGEYSKHQDNWEKNTIINLLDSLKGETPKIIIDCGTEDFFIDVNRKAHQKLLTMKVAHTYTERPGSHNGKYWKNSLKYQVLFFDEFFKEGSKI